MELLPTFRTQLDVLDPYLDDVGVHEILIAGPDRVFVTRDSGSERLSLELPERRIRSLADRLLRALGGRPDRHEVRTGPLGPELEISVIGSPRGERCPVMRLHRRTATQGVLADLVAKARLSATAQETLSAAVEARRSVVVVAPFGAPGAQIVCAVAGAWRENGRVLGLDEDAGPLANAGCADLVFGPNISMEALKVVAPDVVIAMEPPPPTWTGLLLGGRPFVVAIEAPDADAGLERLIALALAGDARLSRSAAESLVHASAATLLELGPGRSLWVKRVGRSVFHDGKLAFDGEIEAPLAPVAAGQRLQPVKARARSDAGDLEGLNMDTAAFPSADLVEELSNEIAEAEAALQDDVEFEAEDDVQEPDEPEAELEPEPELNPRGVTNPNPSPFDNMDAATSMRLRREPAERMATVTGPPQPIEVVNQVAEVLEEIGLPSESVEVPELTVSADAIVPLDDEVMTSHVVAPPNLDPFETHDSQYEPGPLDSTQAAAVAEMLSGIGLAGAESLAIPVQPTVSRPLAQAYGADEWDEEAPSELISRGDLNGASVQNEFEDEKTPVAPLFESTPPRGARRMRRRAPSAADADGPATESAAEELGDPTRRRKDGPERPRTRRRQRDRS